MKLPNYSYTKDQDGNDLLLKDGAYQVMMAWEKPYMEACIEALQPSGDVLEIGFGLGYSANAIQTYPIRSHTIIEYHPTVMKRAREWSALKKGVTLIEDTWQKGLSKLGTFDAIFFDDYPLESLEEHEQIQKLDQKNKDNMELVAIPNEGEITRDEFKSFFDHLCNGEMNVIEPNYLYTFISDLEKSGQISSEDANWALDVAISKNLLSKKDCISKQSFLPQSHDRLYHFLQTCLDNHMKKGARFSCYLESSHSRFDDPFFYNEIILNPHLTYSEKTIQVTPPEHCAYFTGNDALLITVQKW